ncbi:hypothetical protein ACHQM5_004661 [Ranunculus cassubicifolius]
MEEFQECEVLWADQYQHTSTRDEPNFDKNSKQLQRSETKSVSIQENMAHRLQSNWKKIGYGEEDEEEKMMPPHEMLAKRYNGKMAFSVCTGKGRTLKGSDLSRVRNSILRKTGFLEKS